MSDSLPENSFSGVLRVVKLLTGEELIGLVNEATPEKITIKLPAKLESYMNKDSNGNARTSYEVTAESIAISTFTMAKESASKATISEPANDPWATVNG